MSHNGPGIARAPAELPRRAYRSSFRQPLRPPPHTPPLSFSSRHFSPVSVCSKWEVAHCCITFPGDLGFFALSLFFFLSLTLFLPS